MKSNSTQFDTLEDLVLFLKEEAESNLRCELCSMIGVSEEKKIIYKKMPNRSKNPIDFFIIDPYDFLSFIKENDCLCIFHTHLIGDEQPSDFDKMSSENCCYPFLIYSTTTEKFHIYEPEYKDYDVNIIQRLKELI